MEPRSSYLYPDTSPPSAPRPDPGRPSNSQQHERLAAQAAELQEQIQEQRARLETTLAEATALQHEIERHLRSLSSAAQDRGTDRPDSGSGEIR